MSSCNALARAVFMHRLGEIRDRGLENQLPRQRTDITYSGDHVVEHGIYRKSD